MSSCSEPLVIGITGPVDGIDIVCIIKRLKNAAARIKMGDLVHSPQHIVVIKGFHPVGPHQTSS